MFLSYLQLYLAISSYILATSSHILAILNHTQSPLATLSYILVISYKIFQIFSIPQDIPLIFYSISLKRYNEGFIRNTKGLALGANISLGLPNLLCLYLSTRTHLAYLGTLKLQIVVLVVLAKIVIIIALINYL